jgi:hypothetical protein
MEVKKQAGYLHWSAFGEARHVLTSILGISEKKKTPSS